MSVASSNRPVSERSVAEVVAEWRLRCEQGEVVDSRQMLHEIEQARQAEGRSESLSPHDFPDVAPATDEPGQSPTVVVPRTADLPSTPTAGFEKPQSRHKGRFQSPASTDGSGRGLDDYEILREIAHGGMGVVYEARQKSLNRIVALKMIKAAELANEEEVARFYAEAEAAANLRHPNIVAVYEVGRAGEHADQHYFTMDYIGGPSLLQMIRKQPLAPREAAQYVAKIARAVQFAHERNVLHRDLKPSNILLSDDGEPLVTDFGLAKRVDRDMQLTMAGAVIGTPAYMPPEQARGDQRGIGPAADIYSLGAILYECVTGRPPFVSSSLTEMLSQVLEDEPLPPSKLIPRLPRDYETICLKCLEKLPKNRYVTAGELADDLERFLRDEPILARPIGTVERALKFVRRKPLWAALWSVLAASVLTVLVVVALYSRSLATKNSQLTTAVIDLEKQTKLAEKQTKLAEKRLKSERRSNYATKVQKTEDYWSDDPPNLLRGEELLNTLVPEAGDEDLRGFEWYFLKRICRPVVPLFAREMRIEALVARDDGAVLVSDAQVKPIVAEFRAGQQARLWHQDHGNDVQQFFFTRKGPWCAALLNGNVLERRRWEAPYTPGQVVVRMPNADFLTAIADDGSLVAYAVPAGRLAVWDAAAEKVTHVTEVDVGGLVDLRFSPDSQWVLLRGTSEVLAVELATGEKHSYQTKRARQNVAGATFSPDSRVLAITFADASVDLYELRSTDVKPIKSYSLLKFQLYPCGIAFFPDGKKIALSSSNSLIVILDLVREVPFVYRGHRSSADRLSVSPDGQTLYTGALDGEVLAWDANVEDYRAQLIRDEQPGEFPLTFHSLVYSPDGRWLALGGGVLSLENGKEDTGRVLLIDVPTRRIVQRIDAPRPVRSCSFSPDSQRLLFGEASVLASATFLEWDIAAGKLLREWQPAETHAHSAAYLAGGGLLLGRADGTLQPVKPTGDELAEWQTRMPVQDHATKPIEQLVASADGKLVFSKNFGHLLRLWDAGQGKELFWSAGHMSQSAMALSAHGDLAAWTTPDQRLQNAGGIRKITSSPETQSEIPLAPHHRAILFDLKQRKIRYVVAGHARTVHALAISDDARRLASGDATGTIKVWDTETGSELLSMEGHSNGVRAIAFHPGGRQMASIGGDPYARIWWTE